MTCIYCSRETKGKRTTCDNRDCKYERARQASLRWYARHRHELLKKRGRKSRRHTSKAK